MTTESFWGTQQHEVLVRKKWKTRDELQCPGLIRLR